ncbi:MAG: hypothetical protein A3D31_06420 [Candidatus Fluviicola riflensis]|nr:MAG: hypothetical protein CHH17_08595 [Candidatus Fluviicola riflensis]OGS79597.1 MAG: hypothetical protein A3D31_06420 [Candidatus Fluviicola riflensis]OGS87028.1 MAG: hypothetical protein A2724_05880 [Fluviicola sp. RIFCSPHIGHO2_01_FULL_43_53]OGS89820.1 MAG: hypothetical protein A3E30_02630 [Fluviicola sp. RIFCSPHIGHO2_12_FULL_43_24]
MSKKWCKLIVYVVLVSFIALLMPKALWHDCNHQDHQLAKKEHLPGKSIDQGVEKCAVCDLHIPLLSNPVQQLSTAGKTLNSAEPFTVIVAVTHAFPLTKSLRGPPVEMA